MGKRIYNDEIRQEAVLFDPETGLYYYHARYYDPQQGRFLETDPVGYEDDVNLYAYARNEPLNNNDPLGREIGAAFSSINCATDRNSCQGGVNQDLANTGQPTEVTSAEIKPVLEGAENAADLGGKIVEGAQAGAAAEGAITDLSSFDRHLVIGKSVQILGRAAKIADVVEAGTQAAQGDIKGAAGTGINSAIGGLAVMGAVALGANPPVAIGVGALAALGADVGDVGEKLLTPVVLEPTLEQLTTWGKLRGAF